MTKLQSFLSLAVISGLSLLLSFTSAKGQDLPIPFEDDPTLPSPVNPLSGCSPLPEQPPPGTVAVYIVKMQDKPGFVCARAVNGTGSFVSFHSFRLQQRDQDHFQDFDPLPPLPPGAIVGETAVHFGIMAGQRLERQLPTFSPAPPGRYRACFRYQFAQDTEGQEVCSEEFTLP